MAMVLVTTMHLVQVVMVVQQFGVLHQLTEADVQIQMEICGRTLTQIGPFAY